MKKTLLTLALASSISPAFAATFPDFTIDESSVPGTAGFGTQFTADKLNGGYSEIFSVVAGMGGLEFSTQAYADFGAFFSNDGGTVVTNTLLGGALSPQYQLYAIFTSTGTVTNSGGSAQFNGTAGTFSLFIDTDSNTTKSLGADGFSAINLGNTADDYLIASSTSLLSLVNVIGNPGAFDLWFNEFTLTTGDQNATLAGDQNGESYFVKPDPFYLITNVDGDFDNLSFADIQDDIANTGKFTSAPVTGDVSAIFAIPEPATVALLGIGLIGLGYSSRKQNQSFSA